MDKAVIIPCYNESKTIYAVVSSFRAVLPQARIIVFDNGSSDISTQEALRAGAEVFAVHAPGKGNVVRQALKTISADIYIVVDGDDTYDAADVQALLRPIQQGHVDMAIGKRYSTGAAMPSMNRLGNLFFSWLASHCFRTKLNDILSGYRAFNRRVVENVPILTFQFEVETEMTLQALHCGLRVAEFPVRYRPRPVGSRSKLRPLQDGVSILLTIVSLFRDLKPLTFFGSCALLVWMIAVIYGYILYRIPGDSTVFHVVMVIALGIIGWILFLIGFAVHAIDRRFSELRAIMERAK